MRIPIVIGGLVVALLAAPSVRADGRYHTKQHGFMFFSSRLPAHGYSNAGPQYGYGPRLPCAPQYGPPAGCIGYSGPHYGPPAGCSSSDTSGPLANMGIDAALDLLCRQRGGVGSTPTGGLSPEVAERLKAIESALAKTASKDDVAVVNENLKNKLDAVEKKLTERLTAVGTDMKAVQDSVKQLDTRLKVIEDRLKAAPPIPGRGKSSGPLPIPSAQPALIPSPATVTEIPLLPAARRE